MTTEREAQVAVDETVKERARRLEKTVTLLHDRIRLLLEENAHLATMLRERGVSVRVISQVRQDLPAPLTDAIDVGPDGMPDTMSNEERDLFRELCSEDRVTYLVHSQTHVDVGRWFSKGALWAAAASTELVLFAAGKRPFFEKVPYAYLGKSLYNHVTGEVILAPAESTRTSGLRLTPEQGYQLLAQIYKEEDNA